ncbi:MAG TPA: hypothetical protein VF683_11890 [Chthoniobacterales bacterium]|jgi:hypothetical protein
MKKYLLIGFLAAATVASAGAQTQSFTAQGGTRDQRVQREAPPPPARRGEIGAFPRAIRGGNPLQLINPRAPRKYYGAPQDTVTVEPFRGDPHTRSQITGVILFGVVW